ncbi:MAG: twin-arginine translocation signal domain-containing protein [Alphaproteobacteria bacterium]|nr:MAG: twin-arginine translocation signal domain-containing protein [Alphaproteobacteria bacterium]
MTNRRDFLKLGAIAASAGLLGSRARADARLQSAGVHAGPLLHGGKDFSPITYEERKAVPSACYQCVTRCPMVGYVENGRLEKISPQMNSIRTEGTLCAKAQAGVNHVYDPDRILYPMRRVGKRGEGKWKRVRWDEALDEIAERLKKLRDAGTPEKFMFHYGRMKSSTSKMVKSVFLATYGTGTIGDHTSICEGSKWVAQELSWGGHYDNWDFDNTQFILNFGSNVFEAHTNHTPVAHRLARALVERNLRMITFDVRLSNTAAKSSEWIPVKPGTDIAVILAMCNVIVNEDLMPVEGREFLRFCRVTRDVGATTEEKIAALKAHLAEYTPEWAEGISGVPAEKIVAIARELASKHPAAIISYRGPITHAFGVEAERALQMLAAITGNIDNPGGRLKAVGPKWKYPKGPKDKPKSGVLEVTKGFEGQVAFPNHHVSNQIFDVIREGSFGRPEVYMWYKYQPVYSNGDCKANEEILKDESILPFTVAVTPFYDESAALADLILPEATYLERWDWEDMVSPNQVPEYYIRQPIVPPMGETRDFGDVVCDLAERMGMPLGFKTKEEFVRLSCEMTPEVKAAGGFEYMKTHGVYHNPQTKPVYYSYLREIPESDYKAEDVIYDVREQLYWNWKKSKARSREEALEKGYMHTKNAYKGYVGQRIGDKVYRGFVPDKVNKTGYMEIYSELMEEKGFKPMPSYYPIPEHQELGKDDLILTTFKVNVQSHSRTQNCKWLTEIYHANPAWINPETAAARGIANGDLIKVKSEKGEITTKARVTPAVVPGVVAISNHCGHWKYGRYASGSAAPEEFRLNEKDPDLDRIWWSDDRGAHPNWLIPNKPDPIGGEQRWNDTVVKVEKVAAA